AVQDPVFRFCLMQMGCEDKAREATQETALRIIQNYSRFDGRSKVTTWALGIALNVCRELRRKREKGQSGVELEEVSESKPGDCPLERAEQIDQLQIAMQQLTERQRETLTLRYLEGISVSETARILQMAEGTVKATTYQALDIPRRLIGAKHESP
ncbi:MAG: sigma-70 family RNA polymerase sigma factor, partial [Planctomycetota bacterium]